MGINYDSHNTTLEPSAAPGAGPGELFVGLKSFDVFLLMTYHMQYDKEVKKYDHIDSVRSKKAPIQSC
jgi:hypothetical protein